MILINPSVMHDTHALATSELSWLCAFERKYIFVTSVLSKGPLFITKLSSLLDFL
jgi:hypothetical protein